MSWKLVLLIDNSIASGKFYLMPVVEKDADGSFLWE